MEKSDFLYLLQGTVSYVQAIIAAVNLECYT